MTSHNKAIVSGVFGAYYRLHPIINAENINFILAKPAGNLKKNKPDFANRSFRKNIHTRNLLNIGDIVEYQMVKNSDAVITRIENRKNVLVRSSKDRSQILGTNISQVCVIMSIFNPRLNFGFLDRVLVEACSAAIPVTIIVNKKDLKKKFKKENEKEYFQDQSKIDYYSKLGYNIHSETFKQEVSKELKTILEDKTNIFIGQSGVGKSSFLNLIAGKEVQATRELDKNAKGKHTTTNSILYQCNHLNANVIDTPGVREFSLLHLNENEISEGFREFENLECKFADCKHIHEPGCQIKEKVKTDDIPLYRYESYVSILESLDEKYKLRRGNLI
jgi:ribosome biogenesis GTPase